MYEETNNVLWLVVRWLAGIGLMLLFYWVAAEQHPYLALFIGGLLALLFIKPSALAGMVICLAVFCLVAWFAIWLILPGTGDQFERKTAAGYR